MHNVKGDRINVDTPLWDQETYFGRWRHMAFITDSRTIIVPKKRLLEAKEFCDNYKNEREPEDTDVSDVVYAKKLKDSAFHPYTGELIPRFGRMSFQLPGLVALTTAMLTFYKSTCGLVGCQIVNQVFNTFVNYTNRNITEDDVYDTEVITQAFLCATAASCATALAFRRLALCKGTVAARWVPFYAVTAGNMINMPVMRQKEIAEGIPTFAKDAEDICIIRSRVAAVKGISECVLTRIIVIAPGMLTVPLLTQRIKWYCFYQLRPWIGFPIELCLCTACLLFMIPSAYAIFPQKNSLKPGLLKIYPPEYEEFEELMQGKERPDRLYYCKGL